MKSTALTAVLVCAFIFTFAPELFAQSSNPIQKQQEAVGDKPFAKLGSNGGCSALSAVDSLIIELQNDSTNATGYINVYGQKDETVKNYVRLWQIKNQIKKRHTGLDASRIKVTTGELRADESTEFWIVPGGKQPPPVVSAEWDYKLSRKPQELNSYCGYYDDSESNEPKLLIEFLNRNPDFYAEVRVFKIPVKEYRKIAKEAVADLVKNGVPRTRIKTVLLKTPPGPDTYALWLVPVGRSTKN